MVHIFLRQMLPPCSSPPCGAKEESWIRRCRTPAQRAVLDRCAVIPDRLGHFPVYWSCYCSVRISYIRCLQPERNEKSSVRAKDDGLAGCCENIERTHARSTMMVDPCSNHPISSPLRNCARHAIVLVPRWLGSRKISRKRGRIAARRWCKWRLSLHPIVNRTRGRHRCVRAPDVLLGLPAREQVG